MSIESYLSAIGGEVTNQADQIEIARTMLLEKAACVGGAFNTPTDYFGLNPRVVFEAKEHFTLADLNFDVNGSYSSGTAVTLRAGGQTIGTVTNVYSDKNYYVWIRSTSKMNYTDTPPKTPWALASIQDKIWDIATGYSTYQSSGRENVARTIVDYGNTCNNSLAWRRNSYGLHAYFSSSFSPTVNSNADPTDITLKNAEIRFVPHGWHMATEAIPFLNVNTSYVDVIYQVIEVDKFSLMNMIEKKHIEETGLYKDGSLN